MPSQWKALSCEEYDWQSSYSPDLLSNRQREWVAQHKTYEAAIPLKIADIAIAVSDNLRATIDDALLVMGRFDMLISQKEYSLPHLLLRSESASSSQIEHLTASSRNIALAQISEDAPSNSRIVSNNIDAMKTAMSKATSISKDAILHIHKDLLSGADVDYAGRFRDEQVWIGGSNLGPGGAEYVPPYHTRIDEAVDDLIVFAKRADLGTIIKAAVAHAQFETIHPFVDGNGRTGRTLLHIVLRQEGALHNTAVPLSAGLLNNIDAYFDALTSYRRGSPEPIIQIICDAIGYAVVIGGGMVDRIEELLGNWRSSIKAHQDARIWDLLNLLVEQPVINAEFVASRLEVTNRAAYSIIETAVKNDVLKKIGTKHRGIYYEARAITQMLDIVASEDGLRRLAASV